MRAQGGQTEDGRVAAATEDASSEDEVLRSAMFAGFSSEEASVFLQEKKNSQVAQVIYSIAHWLRTWAILQKAELRPMVVEATQYLVQVAMDYFSRAHGWRSSLRIDYH